MHALTFDTFGEPQVLAWRDIPTPAPAVGQVRVRIAAAGLNFADVYRRRGNYHMVATPPWVLGYEGAGTVDALGDGVTGFAPGDRVAFADSPKANAEYAVVDAERLVPVPADVELDVAAALLLQGLTAHYLVRDSYAVRPGDVAVVHAAAGGVGLLLTQMLVDRSARVFALASSPAKQAAAREAGATWVQGYDGWVEAFRAAVPDGAHVVYDSVGSTLDGSLDVARVGGHVVFYGFAGGDPAPVDPRRLMDRSVSLTGGDLWNVLTSAAVRRERAAELFDAVRQGRLRVRIDARIPMRDGAQAHALLESRRTIGKIVLTCD